jgi:antitoxin MazE
MKAKLIPIGNSRGVRLPKPFIQEAGLKKEVDINIRNGEIIIRPIERARHGWEEAAKQLHNQKDDTLLDKKSATYFDEKEWKW